MADCAVVARRARRAFLAPIAPGAPEVRMRRLLRLVLVLASFGPLVLLAGVRLGSWTPRWWLEALDTFALYAFAPFLITIVLARVLRSRALALVSIGAVALFAHQFGDQVLSVLGPPDRAASAAPAAQLRVLTLNLYGSSVNREALVELLRTWRPDVVLLQEVTPRFAETVRPSIAGEYPYEVAVGLDYLYKGGVTWSRLPLGTAERLELGDAANVLHRVSVSTAFGDVWFYNVHLANPTSLGRDDGLLGAFRRLQSDQRDQELGRLAEQTARAGGSFVLAGDFNIPAGSRAYRAFPSAWRDAFAEAGRGFGHTFPATVPGRRGAPWSAISLPLIRIDYILTSPGLRPRAAWTQRVAGTDHLAVIADLEPSGER
jgi:vancomycin resistance protein VanJ